MGLSLSDVYQAIQLQLAPNYVDQFTYGGRVKRVYVQADAPFRRGTDAFQHLFTPSGVSSTATGASGSSSSTGSAGQGSNINGYVTPANPTPANTAISPYNLVPLSSVIKAHWGVGPQALPRYNGYAAVEIVGNSSPGYSTGQAMQALQNIINKSLPGGFASDWTGQSYQEILAGNSATLLLVLSIVVVFLCLAALYESWSIPAAVLLVVPLGVLGMVTLCKLAGIPNDIYFKIGLVTVIGLAAKNAILIVEFAVALRGRGQDAVRSGDGGWQAPTPPHPHDLDGVHPGAYCRWSSRAAPAPPRATRSARA